MHYPSASFEALARYRAKVILKKKITKRFSSLEREGE